MRKYELVLVILGSTFYILLLTVLCLRVNGVVFKGSKTQQVQVTAVARSSPIIINHSTTNLSLIPTWAIQNAKSSLHIAYGHTSHGSQIISGMTGLVGFKGDNYKWNSGGTGGALDIRDKPFTGAYDLGNPDFTAWITATKNYLNANSGINVIMWSWCGEVSWANESNINTYLQGMNSLEKEYPNVTFVYMTGHLDGTGVNGNLNVRNEQIRSYCKANNKVLYDFADIESYDPDGNYFLNKGANDACDYSGGNWATNWQNNHPGQWYNCDSAHSQPLNANLKAYSAWWLFSRLAGWDGSSIVNPTSTPKPTATPTPTIKPTLTPIPTTKPTSIPTVKPTSTPTPIPTFTPGVSTLNIKMAFAGVKPESSQCAVNSWYVKTSIKNNTGSDILDKVLIGMPTQTNVVNSKGEVIYNLSYTVNGISASGLNNLAFLLNGEYHLPIKYGKTGQNEWYSSLVGTLGLIGGTTNTYDFSEYSLPAGDVTGSTTGVPDGKIDGRDFSYIKERATTLATSENPGVAWVVGDIDGNCQVNSGDIRLIKQSLTELNSQLY